LVILKKLFKQTFIYGLATVLPRALAIFLVPLYVLALGKEQFGIYASLMAFLVLGNVLLSYGMETAFFRFINKDEHQKENVQSTALFSLTVTALFFLVISLSLKSEIATFLNFKVTYIIYGLLILSLDALVVIPFVWLRANERPTTYAIIKILNVVINLGFNLFFFLALPFLAKNDVNSFWNAINLVEGKVAYVFISNLIASGITFLILIPLYFKIKLSFDQIIWRKMMKYALPVLIAGIAFSINEAFDKILLRYLLPAENADAELGMYAACYKLGVFMTLFATAFRLGIEPFFFKHSQHENAKEIYATITKYFAILGSFILLFVVVYLDFFKSVLIPDSSFWEALVIVPIILLANLCLGIYHNLSVWYKVTDRTKFGAYISVFGAFITLTLNFILIPIISYRGSAIATLAAYGSMMLVSYFFGRKYYKVPYDIKKIGFYLLLSIVFSVLSFYVFRDGIWEGTLLLVLFLGMIFVSEKKEIKQLIKR
jgi:O-antigen/teichoic acid export membrane protein